MSRVYVNPYEQEHRIYLGAFGYQYMMVKACIYWSKEELYSVRITDVILQVAGNKMNWLYRLSPEAEQEIEYEILHVLNSIDGDDDF